MTEWKPTVEKWQDEDNYNIVKPAWRRMLDKTLEYKESKEVLTVLTQLGRRNLTGDDIQMYVIGYLLHQKNVDLEEYMSDNMISRVQAFSSKCQNIYVYTVFVLKECHVSDAVIDEFAAGN